MLKKTDFPISLWSDLIWFGLINPATLATIHIRRMYVFSLTVRSSMNFHQWTNRQTHSDLERNTYKHAYPTYSYYVRSTCSVKEWVLLSKACITRSFREREKKGKCSSNIFGRKTQPCHLKESTNWIPNFTYLPIGCSLTFTHSIYYLHLHVGSVSLTQPLTYTINEGTKTHS